MAAARRKKKLINIPPNWEILGEISKLMDEWTLLIMNGNHDKASLELLRDDIKKSMETWR